MSTIDNAIKLSLANYLRSLGLNVRAVTAFTEKTTYGGYCETCSYEEQVMEINYKTQHGSSETYRFSGTFKELINTLDYYSENA